MERRVRSIVTGLLLSLVTGVLLVLIFPRFNFTGLAPIALTPLLIACAREPKWKRRFLNGWASGILFWFFVCTWIQFVLEVHGGMGRGLAWFAFCLFAVLKGLHTALFAALAGSFLRFKLAIPAIAALWTAIEFAHGSLGLAWLGLGFSWLDLGNAAIDWPFLLRLAPITGVYGISFVLAMIGAAIALSISNKSWRPLAPLASILLLLALPSVPPPAAATESVQVLQPNVDTETRWTEQSFADFEDRLATLSVDEPAPLIVWPEAPAPFVPDRPAFRNYISGVAKSAHASLLFGGIAYTPEGSPLNSAFILNSDGDITARYDKIQLVPFGEYIPPAFGWVNRITGEAGDFVPGKRVIPFAVNTHNLGVFICYESAFPGLVRRFTQAGAQLLVNISNDGYFGDSAAREQHLSLARMRAVENNRWLLRSTNDGITAMIDPAGRITETIPSHTQTSELMHFNYTSGLTLYARYGDWFAWGCFAVSALSCAGLRVRRRP
jgi:apolipoprotein N-acyltransferase